MGSLRMTPTGGFFVLSLLLFLPPSQASEDSFRNRPIRCPLHTPLPYAWLPSHSPRHPPSHLAAEKKAHTGQPPNRPWEEGSLRMLRNLPSEMSHQLKGKEPIWSKRSSEEAPDTCLHLMTKSMVAFMVCEMQRATRLRLNFNQQFPRLH